MESTLPRIRATTILAVRRDGKVALGGDGQVTVGETVMKSNAQKVRALHGGQLLAGFAGSAADAFTLFEKFEEKLERYPNNLSRAAVELAKDWRSDRVLRRLEARGYLTHHLDGKIFVYEAAMPAQRVAAGAVRQIIKRFWSGSVEQFLVGMVDEKVLSAAEIRKLAKRVKKAR